MRIRMHSNPDEIAPNSDNGLQQVLFNRRPALGRRREGLACLPSVESVPRGYRHALDYAETRTAGAFSDRWASAGRQRARDAYPIYIEQLHWAALEAA